MTNLLNSRERYLVKAAPEYHEQFLSRENADHWAVNAGLRYLNDHGLPMATKAQRDRLDRYELGVVVDPMPGDDDFAGMLVFPYLTPARVKGLKFRNLRDSKPKNLVHDGHETRLYNVQAYFDAGDVIGVCEGEADAICATERLGIPTIGIPGSEVWKAKSRIWASLFKNFQDVYVFTDGDKVNPETGLRPGEELGKQLAASLGWRARIIRAPEGQDVSSMVAAGRQQELEAQYRMDDDDDSV